ncbi:HicB-like antitoxin [Mycobacterium phage SirPhilip]|uniref:HicB-like antitoxin n=1 Tax=Mycobacterium phage SirPhilip TaxID=2015824 RepID=A0A222ZKK9_9CAUD|nr:HicB-like antitoxin [Mycobacterium phage SirPhilip]ASR85294.1 HicB-like antitoxin [Mycobacterium phage SirPhilip]
MDTVTKYAVTVTRGERYWVLHVPAIDQYTQARTDDEIVPMARDLIATWLDVPLSEVEVEVTMPG